MSKAYPVSIERQEQVERETYHCSKCGENIAAIWDPGFIEKLRAHMQGNHSGAA